MSQSPSPSDDNIDATPGRPYRTNTVGLDAYQEMAHDTAMYSDNIRILGEDGTSIPLYPFLGLAEAVEALGKIKKVIRDDNGRLSNARRIELMFELGDTLWYVAECARVLGYPLSYVARMNIQKLLDRKQRNTLQGDGDVR